MKDEAKKQPFGKGQKNVPACFWARCQQRFGVRRHDAALGRVLDNPRVSSARHVAQPESGVMPPHSK